MAVAAVVLALGIGTACLALGAEGELYYIIPVAMLTAGVYGLVQFKDTREYVIDLDAARYAFFLRFMGWRTLVCTLSVRQGRGVILISFPVVRNTVHAHIPGQVHAGALHNAYIRLVKRVASGGQPYYYLTFNGFRMEKHNLTSAVRDKARRGDWGAMPTRWEFPWLGCWGAWLEPVKRRCPSKERKAGRGDGCDRCRSRFSL